jgi:hypothetical protein
MDEMVTNTADLEAVKRLESLQLAAALALLQVTALQLPIPNTEWMRMCHRIRDVLENWIVVEFAMEMEPVVSLLVNRLLLPELRALQLPLKLK